MRPSSFSLVLRLGVLLLPALPVSPSLLRAENARKPVEARNLACDRIRFFPDKGAEKSMQGGTFAGSNQSRWEGFETLAEIKEVPAAGQWTEIPATAHKAYRWLRYQGPEGSAGKKVARIEWYAGDKVLAASQGKGITYGSFDTTHAVEGFDLADGATAQRPSFTPKEPDQDGPVDVAIATTRGAEILYTTDGAWPDATHGSVYKGPVHIDKSTTFSAVGLLPDHAPSLLNTTTYLLPGSSKPGLNTAHIGNSLTGTTGGFFRFARTAGYDHKSVAFLRPGALTRELLAVADGTYVSDPMAKRKEEASQKRGVATWSDFWSKVGKVDLLTLQPRDFDLDKELAAEISFIKLFREKSPDVQPWLYSEWVEMVRQRPSDKGEVPSYQMRKTFPALTWEESMGAMLLYVEELQHRLGEQFHEGKPVHIIPASLAMGWIHHMIDHGGLPRVKPGSFYPLLFNDQVHPADAPIHGTANGAFLVDMTWYSAFYKEPSEGKVLAIETTFTAEQVRAVQRLAWDVIKNYPDCGLYEEGTQPCGQPQFANDGKAITLSSSTPGAWFRYTLDGTVPTRTRGYVYCGVISMQPGIQVKAVAYKSGMADSPAAEMKP